MNLKKYLKHHIVEVQEASWVILHAIYRYGWFQELFLKDEQLFSMMTVVRSEYNISIEEKRKEIFVTVARNPQSGATPSQLNEIRKIINLKPRDYSSNLGSVATVNSWLGTCK